MAKNTRRRKTPKKKPAVSQAKQPSGIDSQLSAARQFHRNGQMVEAEACFRRILALDPAHREAASALASMKAREGAMDQAILTLHAAVTHNPRQVELYNELCAYLTQVGRIQDAGKAAQQAIAVRPDSPIGYFQLAGVLLRLFRPSEAARVAEEGLKKAGEDPFLYTMVGDAYTDSVLYAKAVPAYERAIAMRPNVPELHTRLGNVLMGVGRLEEAKAQYERSFELQPVNPAATSGMANLLATMGRRGEAVALVQEALRKSPGHRDLALTFARLAKSPEQMEAAITEINRVLRDRSLPKSYRAQFHLALGSMKEQIEQYDDAFSHYQQGNDLYPSQFNLEVRTRAVEVMFDAYEPETYARYPRSTIRSGKPIFIVGMPRSGTSLLEQILASHPEVYAGGENQELFRVVGTMHQVLGCPDKEYPLCLPMLTTEKADELARAYLDAVSAEAGNAKRITNKAPVNYVHLGAISLLLPDAYIIHSMRHPLDTCFSCYATRLGPAHDYTNNLQHLAEMYRLYHRIMEFWKQRLDIPILDVQYEEVVASPEESVRRILDFCGLEFHPDCLKFHETRRATMTASVDQVQQPLYQTSVARYRRFEKHLRPLVEGLGDLIDPAERASLLQQ